ncbi:unnamed protein product [Cunninghamella echinulata]
MRMNITKALKDAGLIPNVIDEGFTPDTLLLIKYGDKDVEMGNHISPQEGVQPPQIRFIPAEEDAEYTLFLIDPDAPSRADPKNGPFRHWVVTNIPGSSQEQIYTATSLHTTTYMGPKPPGDTGNHRYVFLLYKQRDKSQKFQALSNDVRKNFDFKQYARDNDLELVGVNFFYSSSQ